MSLTPASTMNINGLPEAPSFASHRKLSKSGGGSSTTMQLKSNPNPALNKGGITIGSKIRSRFFVKDRTGKPSSIEVCYFSSSNVVVAQYDHARQVLSITFSNRSVYEYMMVPKQFWEQMKRASSVGRFVYYSIRKRFHYRRVR